MTKPIMIIVTGLPGTGKTTLSRQVADKLAMPLIAKDAFKEIIFDCLGWSDKEWTRKVGQTAFRLMDAMIEQQLRSGGRMVVEANFQPHYDNDRLQQWQQQYAVRMLQIHCVTPIDILAQRIVERAKQDRHPGHNDKGLTTEAIAEDLRRRSKNGEDGPLAVEGAIIRVDTSDFTKVSLENILHDIDKALEQGDK